MLFYIFLLFISLSYGYEFPDVLKYSFDSIYYALNYYRECKMQFSYDRIGLINDFKTHLYGQHLISDIIIRLLDTHISNPQPSKALVLSLHGSTGTGKNHIARLITNNLFKHGLYSDYANLIISTHYFKHEEHIKEYQDSLASWIVGNVSKCPHSVFIFDEMDKMPISLIDTLIPFIDFHPNIGGKDFRKAIFIMLSNSASGLISYKVLKHWQNGYARENITFESLEHVISESAYNDKGGLWHTRLIEKDLISAYIPLLPLERSHVKMCIEDYLSGIPTPLHIRCQQEIKKDPSLLNTIANLLLYEPEDLKIFSATGCKNVPSKVDYFCAGFA